MRRPGGLAAVVPAAAWTTLLREGTRHVYRPGETLMWHGDTVSHVVALVDGLVKVWRDDAAGNRLVLAVRGPGEVLGEIGVVGTDDTRSANVTALDVCDTRIISADRFDELIQSLRLEGKLLRHMVRRFREGEDLRAELAVLPAELKVARGVAHLAEWLLAGTGAPPNARVDVGLNQTELGQAVGLHRGSIHKPFAKLRRLGLVTTQRRHIVVNDLERLRAFGQG